MDEESKCELCYGEIIILNKVLTCSNCKLVIGKLTNMRDKQNNKNIHLNNVLRSFEITNATELETLHKELLEDIKEKKIKPKFVERTYINNFLNKRNIPGYVKSLLLYNRYKNLPFQLTDEIKENIRIVFWKYNSYINKQSSSFSDNSISYELILYLIIKRLDINLDVRLCATKSVNDKLIKSFSDFENYLCEKEEKKIEDSQKLYCLPNIPLKVYDLDLIS